MTIIPSLLFFGCTPPEVKFDAFGTSKHGEGKSLLKFFLPYLSVHWGDLTEQIKKICHIHFKSFGDKGEMSSGSCYEMMTLCNTLLTHFHYSHYKSYSIIAGMICGISWLPSLFWTRNRLNLCFCLKFLEESNETQVTERKGRT